MLKQRKPPVDLHSPHLVDHPVGVHLDMFGRPTAVRIIEGMPRSMYRACANALREVADQLDARAEA